LNESINAVGVNLQIPIELRHNNPNQNNLSTNNPLMQGQSIEKVLRIEILQTFYKYPTIQEALLYNCTL
jgi:hypothetical protein